MPDTLAQRIKAKYPGVYDDIGDAELEAKVLAKYPGVYDDLPRTRAKTPSRGDASLMALDPEMAFADIAAPVAEAGPRQMGEGVGDLRAGRLTRGTSNLIRGAGTTAATLGAPLLLPAIAAAPGAAAMSAVTGATMEKAGEGAARAVGASEDQSRLIGDITGIASGTVAPKVIPAAGRGVARAAVAAMDAVTNISGTAATVLDFPGVKTTLSMLGVPKHVTSAAVTILQARARAAHASERMVEGMGRAASASPLPAAPEPVPAPSAPAPAMSPQMIRNQVGLAAKRANATLTVEQLEAADTLVVGGLSPVDAVLAIKSAAKSPVQAAKLIEHLDAAAAFAAKFGTPTDTQMRAQIKSRQYKN